MLELSEMDSTKEKKSARLEQIEEDELLPTLLPARVHKPYKKCGWFLYLTLMLSFLAGSSTLIGLKYKARETPELSLELKKENDMKFPSTIIICPNTKGSVSWHYFELIGVSNARPHAEGIESLDVMFLQKFDLACLRISLDAYVVQTPASVEFALTWSQDLDSYSDLLVSFDDDLVSSTYMASGIFNSSKGASNNINLVLERYGYLPTSTAGIRERWSSTTATTDYYYYTISENATAIQCVVSPNLKFTEECTTKMRECPGDKRVYRGTKCAMMSVFYLAINSNLVSNYVEVDPVNWREIIAGIGGYWVYVGAGFSLFFAVRKGTLELIPLAGIQKIFRMIFKDVKQRLTVFHKRKNSVAAQPRKQADESQLAKDKLKSCDGIAEPLLEPQLPL
jgi:hypothetical protein